MEQERRTRAIVGIALAVIIIGLSFIGYLTLIDPAVKVSHIEPDPSLIGTPATTVSHTFFFRNDTITITAAINQSVYKGAQNTDRHVMTSGNVPLEVWVGRSYSAMVFDPAQDELYNDLLRQFREIRDKRNLTDDEYAELLTAYAQSFTYHITSPDSPAKYPVETIHDEAGDCDDLSLVLAGLLSREGYRTSFFLFEKDHHVVVGIGSDENRYLNTDYAYVDIMDYSFIGVPVNALRGSEKMFLDPVVVPIGSGTIIYHSGGQTRYIGDMATLTYRRSGNLSLRMKNLQQDTPGNISEYNRVAGEFNSDSRIYTYIIRHRFDRPGVYEYLKREMPA